MTLAGLLLLAIKISIALSVFGFGLKATFADATSLFRQPGQLLRSVLAMNVVMFVLAVTVVVLLDFRTALEVGLVALSLSPVPPVMPRKLMKAGGGISSAVGLVTAMSVLAIVVVPLGVAVAGALVGKDLGMPILKVASVVLVTILLPLSLGIGLRRVAPRLAERLANPAQRVSAALLLLGIIPLLIMIWPKLSSMFGYDVLIALALFSLVGVAVGHGLGGPDESHRTELALATSTRHPGMVLAIAGINFPNEQGVLAIAIFHVFIAGLVAVPYLAWRRHQRGAGDQAAPTSLRDRKVA